MDEHKLTAGHLMVNTLKYDWYLECYFDILCLFQKVAEMRIINHPHLKNDEFDLIDVIRIKGYFKFYCYSYIL